MGISVVRVWEHELRTGVTEATAKLIEVLNKARRAKVLR